MIIRFYLESSHFLAKLKKLTKLQDGHRSIGGAGGGGYSALVVKGANIISGDTVSFLCILCFRMGHSRAGHDPPCASLGWSQRSGV